VKKQIITASVAFVILAALVLTYIFVQKNRETAVTDTPVDTTADTGNNTIVMISRKKSDITKVTLVNEKGVFTLLPSEDEDGEIVFYLEEYPGLALNKSVVDAIITPMFYLSPYEKLLDNTSSPAEFGFDLSGDTPPAYTKAEYTDGSTETVLIGRQTPGGDFYYTMREGDPEVYLLIPSYGNRFHNGLNEIIDKSLPQIDFAYMYYIYINEKGGNETELKFSPVGDMGDDFGAFKTFMESAGTTMLKMSKPYPGREVYLSTMVGQVEAFSGYALGDLVEIGCDDLSQYGLDEPELELLFETLTSTLHLYVGDYANEDKTKVYVMTEEKNNIFLMDASYLTPFRNMNSVKFIERFAITPLPNIGTVDKIEITSTELNRKHDIRINHADDPPLTDGTGDIAPTIDGVLVDDEDFRMFYRAVLGITIDADARDYQITGEPLFTLKFIFNTDREDFTISLYPYDANFYALRLSDIDMPFLANKQNVRLIFEYLDGLL